MSRSPRSQRRFNDYRPLPPPSPQSKSERANAAKFADELYLLEESTTTPNGTAAPQIVLQNRSPSKVAISPRRESRGRGDYTSGVRLHSRAASDDRGHHGHSAPRRLYHDTLESGQEHVPQDVQERRPLYDSAAPLRHASAPRAAMTSTSVRAIDAADDAYRYSAHTYLTQNVRGGDVHNSPPIRARSSSTRRKPVRQPVLAAPVSKEVQRPPGYRSYARDTFNSRQQRTEKHGAGTDDDLLARVALQRPPWRPSTTPTRDANPLHWAVGEGGHSDRDDDDVNRGRQRLDRQADCEMRRRRRSSTERRPSAPRRSAAREEPVRYASRQRSASAGPPARARPQPAPRVAERTWDESVDVDVDVDYGVPGALERAPRATSPSGGREAQLLEEILGEVERLRVEAKDQRRQLREYRRREKSYLLHIQALERVLQERLSDHPPPRHVDVVAQDGTPRDRARRRVQPPPQSHVHHPPSPAVVGVTHPSVNTSLQSPSLSPVPRTSAQPLSSTNVSATMDGLAEPLPYPSQRPRPRGASQPAATRRTPALAGPAAGAGDTGGVDALLAKLNSLKSIERQLQGELREAIGHGPDGVQPSYGGSLQAQMERQERVLDEVALLHQRCQQHQQQQQQHQKQQKQPRPQQGRAIDSAARAALRAQYGPVQPTAAVIYASTGLPGHTGPHVPASFLDGDRHRPRDRSTLTASGDYAVRVHHSHHVRSEQDPDKAYTVGVQGDPACMATIPTTGFSQRPTTTTTTLDAEWAATPSPSDDSEPDQCVTRTTPPPQLLATVAALRDDALATIAADLEDDEAADREEAARRERARERALLIQSLEVSPTKRNAHLHEVRKAMVARTRPAAEPPADFAEVARETASDADSGSPPQRRAVSEYEVWRSFHDDDEEEA